MGAMVRRRYTALMLGGLFIAVMSLSACGGEEAPVPLPETVPETVPTPTMPETVPPPAPPAETVLETVLEGGETTTGG
jgi:hypothetical protein